MLEDTSLPYVHRSQCSAHLAQFAMVDDHWLAHDEQTSHVHLQVKPKCLNLEELGDQDLARN